MFLFVYHILLSNENIDHNNQTVRIYRGSNSQKKEIIDPKENFAHNEQTVRIYKGSDSQKRTKFP